MPSTTNYQPADVRTDIVAGIVVFLVALPLCLGIAQASGDVPAFSGLVSGIVGGLVVGAISGSSTSVSGPAAGLTAVVAAQVAGLGSFEAFLLAVFFAGVVQLALGVVRAGGIALFVPNAVIKGLLAAIGIILILKQFPHLLGHDADPEGEMSFQQPNEENTFSEILNVFTHTEQNHLGAALVGVLCFVLLLTWERVKVLKSSPIPAALVVVALGTGIAFLFKELGGGWTIESSHRVEVPVPESFAGFLGQFRTADWTAIAQPKVYEAAFVIAAVASLETLLNLEAVDKIDPEQRNSPPNRELVAQGVGNMTCGLIGGLPITSVIVRSSVNVQMGVRSRLSALVHGALLLGFVGTMPWLINEIPLSCLAAILLHTGLKLANPALFTRMWRDGRSQFWPFLVTILAIVFTDLLVGVLLGLGFSVAFLLLAASRTSIPQIREKHLSGDILRIALPNQVTFLNKAGLTRALDAVPRGGHVLVDATETTYIDEDVLDLIREYERVTMPAREVRMSLLGFADSYVSENKIQLIDYSSRDLQRDITPEQVLQLLKEGNERFLRGQRLTRDLGRQKDATAAGQFPLAVVLGCIDSRAPTEMVFDLGLGECFVTRVAGNVAREKVVGGIEYACAVAGAKLIVVMGHTRCGAVTTAYELAHKHRTAREESGLENIDVLLETIQESMEAEDHDVEDDATRKEVAVDRFAVHNVIHTMHRVRDTSGTLARMLDEGRIKLVGAMYDVRTGRVHWVEPDADPVEDGHRIADAVHAGSS